MKSIARTRRAMGASGVCSTLLAFAPLIMSNVHAQEPLAGSSLQLSGGYTGDWRRNTHGGGAVGDAYAQSVDLGAVWSTDAFMAGTRMTANVSVMYLRGGDISGDFVGDLQGVNNLEANSGWRLYESWVEFSLGGSSHSLRAGVLDLNAEFDTPVTQGLFIGSPFGIGTELSQTGARGPDCWPDTGLGIRAAGDVTDNVRWRFGVFDGAPGSDADTFTSTRVSSDEGALFIGEFEYTSERIHKAAIGSWRYTARFAPLDESTPRRGNEGFYAVVDLGLGTFGDVTFDAALRAGTAREDFNAVDDYAGIAVVASNFREGRPDDSLGLGIAYAHTGRPYRELQLAQGATPRGAETLVELTYRAQISEWLALVPNVQFVADPGAQAAPDAWLAGLRFEIAGQHTWRAPTRFSRAR